jgi:hypothetical protein
MPTSNFNYVSPLTAKSYSEWNKERLATKRAAEQAMLKNQLDLQKTQRAMYGDRMKQLHKFKPDDWSALDVEALMLERDYIQQYLPYMDEAQWFSALDGLNAIIDQGDRQAGLYQYDEDYQEGMMGNYNENDFPEGTPDYNTDEYNIAVSNFNNVGITNAETVTTQGGRQVIIGDYLDPTARDGKTTLKQSFKELYGENVQFINGSQHPDGPQSPLLEYAILPDNTVMLVRGDNWRSPWRGKIDTYAVTQIPKAAINAVTFATKWTPTSGAGIYPSMYDRLMKSVNADNNPLTPDAARQKMVNSVVPFANPKDATSKDNVVNAAITNWEQEYKLDWDDTFLEPTGPNKDQPSQLETNDWLTPWDLWGETVADQFDWRRTQDKAPDKSSAKVNEDYNNLLKAVQTVEGATPEYSTAVNDPKYNWSGLTTWYEEEQAMSKLKQQGENFGKGVHITTYEKDMVFDGQKVSKFTIYPKANKALIWLVDPKEGNLGNLSAPNATNYSAWLDFGNPWTQPWIEIDISDGGAYTADYIQLQENFNGAYNAGEGNVPQNVLGSILQKHIR